MVSIPLAMSDWRRETAEEPVVKVQNRFFEQNPSNLQEGSSLLMRPGMRYFTSLGTSPILSMYSQDGAFNNDLFAIQTDAVRRIKKNGTFTENVTKPFSAYLTSTNQGCFSNAIGSTPSNFFFVRGNKLDCYCHLPVAYGTLTLTGQPEDLSVVQLGDVYYKFVAGSVDAGSPAGTSADPWLVNRGTTQGEAVTNLIKAVNGVGSAGTDYSSILRKNSFVNADEYVDDNSIVFYATFGGVDGNTLATTVASTTVMSFATATLEGGAISGDTSRAFAVPLPADDGDPFLREISVKAVVSIASYVVVIIDSEYNGTSGRFYWINPGETWIDPLSFATTESNPDSIVSVRVLGDQLWFLGKDSVEVWSVSGNADLPFIKQGGMTLNYGALENTDIVIGQEVIFAERSGIVYSMGAGVKRISTNAVEEQIRRFQQKLNVYSETSVDYQFRSWTYAADGHIFYILHLGTEYTYVYDLTTGQWSYWCNNSELHLRQHAGVKVYSALDVFTDTSYETKTNPTVVGDVYSGAIWIIDPTYRFDDSYDITSVYTIECVATAGVPSRMRETIKCNELYLTASVGNPSSGRLVYITDDSPGPLITDGFGGRRIWDTVEANTVRGLPILGTPSAGVELQMSDDNGRTWYSAGEIFIPNDIWDTEIVWRSLGVIQAPGRVFRIIDHGVLTRLDGLDMR